MLSVMKLSTPLERAMMLYVAQGGNCDRFKLAGDIDPAYFDAFESAKSRGVEAICWDCSVSLKEITLNRALPIVS
ncbi:MAG: DNA/RNA nuclease SfsA [Alphaproteobacteria bacterium]